MNEDEIKDMKDLGFTDNQIEQMGDYDKEPFDAPIFLNKGIFMMNAMTTFLAFNKLDELTKTLNKASTKIDLLAEQLRIIKNERS